MQRRTVQQKAGANRQSNNSSFLVQGSILAIASILSRIIGLLYRSPLTAILGDLGNDYYSTAFEIYSLLLLISSCSLPLAVSKMVSARMSQGRVKDAYRVFKAAMGFAIFSGLAAGLIVFFFADYFAEFLQTPFCVFALRVLAPTLFIVAILGVIRGFFQGLGTMMPSAVSQIVEQIINAIVSVVAAYYLFSYGAKLGAVLGNQKEYSAAFGAAGGTLGTGLGALAGLLFVLFVFAVYKRVLKRKMRRERGVSQESYRTIFRVLIWTVIPVLLSTTLYNLSAIVDQALFKNVAVLQGYTADEIHVFWGVFGGKYRVLVNVPISIASAVVSASVPAITASFANKDYDSVQKKTANAIHFSMVIAFPCVVGLGVLASPVMQLLFQDSSDLAARMLQVGAISVVFYSLSTLSNGILQGINRMKVPVINAAIALALQAGLLVALMYLADMNIFAVIWANTFFALLMCLLNGYGIYRYMGYRQELKKTVAIPALASAIMGVVVYVVYMGLQLLLKINAISTIVGIIVGAAVYFVLMLVLKGLDEEDLLSFPGGRKLISLGQRLHLL
ncbi:MAG: polysaccharide biosynthesis protein [Eubacterium sp.]|nr:polysaccharide biosynthesis protein [Eubacterium sp.]